MDECVYHRAMEEKISAIEKVVDSLKYDMSNKVSKEELMVIIDTLTEDIKELKEDNEKHFTSNMNTQQTLTRLEEMNKYLKQMLDSYNEQAKTLSEKMDNINKTLNDKIDKLYDLIVNFKKPRENSENEQRDKKNGFIQDVLGNVKVTLTIILLLVATIVYLLTGNWVVTNLP